MRVHVDDVPLRIGTASGHLVNISATGALVRASQPLTPNVEYAMEIETLADAVELGARVIRSSLATDMNAAINEQYLVAVTFTALAPAAKQAVAWLCGKAYARIE